eukprot:jgi/Mesvir1/16690/Mv15086-RA.1
MQAYECSQAAFFAAPDPGSVLRGSACSFATVRMPAPRAVVRGKFNWRNAALVQRIKTQAISSGVNGDCSHSEMPAGEAARKSLSGATLDANTPAPNGEGEDSRANNFPGWSTWNGMQILRMQEQAVADEMNARRVRENISKRINAEYLLRSPSVNRGTAFDISEREPLGLRGLLPCRVETLEEQGERVMSQLRDFAKPINKYAFLQTILNTNQILHYHVLRKHLKELLPIVYTPTVGDASLSFSQNWRAAQGMYFSAADKGHMRSMLDNWPEPEVEIIVVTDGGRILGLGDLGVNGMPIPTGKLSLYVTAGGFHPAHTLPAVLDVGTDNQTLLNDPFYMGNRHARLDGEEYYAVVDEFVEAVKDKWPRAVIQFEDFKTDKAIAVLERHRDTARCFNDDIQGTGAVIAAGLLCAARKQRTRMQDARIVFFGAGSAAVGVADTIAKLIEMEGISPEEARRKFFMVDSKGHITTARKDLASYKVPFANPTSTHLEGASLVELIRGVQPTVLMGLSGQPNMFTQEVIEEMCKSCPNPIIFPLSNPTSKSEVSAYDAVHWSKGTCIFASGSPFGPVVYEGKTIYPMQGNNMFIFPGVGLGTVLCRARCITEGMMIAASTALANFLTDEQVDDGILFPDVEEVEEVSVNVAAAVMRQACKEGVADNCLIPDIVRGDLERLVESCMWRPTYLKTGNDLRPRRRESRAQSGLHRISEPRTIRERVPSDMNGTINGNVNGAKVAI